MDGQTDRQTDRQLCDQLAGMKAIKQCTCNHRLLTSMKVQIGIYRPLTKHGPVTDSRTNRKMVKNKDLLRYVYCFFNPYGP